jgi:hypothetical protein
VAAAAIAVAAAAVAAMAMTATIAMQLIFELMHVMPEAAATAGTGQQQRGKQCQHDSFHHG